MAVINLHDKYEKNILRGFDHESYIGDNASKKYSFEGVRTIKVSTPERMEVKDYQRSGTSRFGTIEEIGDRVQILTLSQDKSYTGSIDRGNASDQQKIKKAGEIIKDQTKNVISPMMDKYTLNKWAIESGINRSIAAPSKANIVTSIFDATTEMDNALVPIEQRRLYVGASVYNMLRLSPEYMGVEALAKKSLQKGVMGEISDCEVVKVPDSLMPAGVKFMIVHKDSVLRPKKISLTRIHTDPVGIDGHVLEGRYYFDAFVLGERAEGVYVGADASIVIAAPTISISANKATLTSAGNVIYYTLDGSDPRYSAKAIVYAAPVDMTSGQTIRVCAKNASKLTSAVAKQTNA